MQLNFRSIVVVTTCVVVWCAVNLPTAIRADDHAFWVAASKITWGQGVDLETIECLTLNRKIGHHIFKVEYSDDPKILDILRKYFPKKEISSNNPSCLYVLTFVIVLSDNPAIQHDRQISRMLMAFSVARKDPMSGELERDHLTGNYKNIYLFRPDVNPLEAFEVGLKAFIANQFERTVLMRISLAETR
jgi:hypothetical protein